MLFLTLENTNLSLCSVKSRLADSEVSEKLLGTIVWELYHCTLFIMEHFSNFNEDMLCSFCMETMAECLKSSRKLDLIKVLLQTVMLVSRSFNHYASFLEALEFLM